jgi:hypothetical protein
VPQGNYLNAFRGPDLAQIDSDAYSNALQRNQVQRLPQQNRAQDLSIQGAEMEIGNAQQKGASDFLVRSFSLMAQDPQRAQEVISSPAFQSASKALQLPAFSVDGETPESIAQKSTGWAQAISGQSSQQRVQSTQVLEDGTIAYVTSDGRVVRTGEKARNDLRFVQSGGGTGAFDPRSGQVAPITTASQETDAAAEKAGAEAWARAAATAGVDLQKEQVGRQATLGVWRVAREGLLAGLKGTNTGPIAGRLPAVTAGQQIAEGGVAAVAPVLKALFRSAGEGVFTDRDQQLLLDMIPNRADHPETITAKMQMIDAIIEAKLTGQSGGGSGPQVGEVQDGYQFIGGDPSQQTSWRKVN